MVNAQDCKSCFSNHRLCDSRDSIANIFSFGAYSNGNSVHTLCVIQRSQVRFLPDAKTASSSVAEQWK
jgi:hypothetical protein